MLRKIRLLEYSDAPNGINLKTVLSEDYDITAGGPLSSLLKGQIVNKPLERLKKRPRPKRSRRPDTKTGNKTWQDNPSDLDECAGYR